MRKGGRLTTTLHCLIAGVPFLKARKEHFVSVREIERAD
jgi:hypothetical protein